MNVLRLLMGQHDAIERKLAELQEAIDLGEAAVARALPELTRTVRLHLELEEAGFFPGILDRLILIGVEGYRDEHRELERLLTGLSAASGPDFPAAFAALRDELVRHVSDEEIELFPEVKRRFSLDELEALGNELQRSLQAREGEQPAPPPPEPTVEHH